MLFISNTESLSHDTHFQQLNCGCSLSLNYTKQFHHTFADILELQHYKSQINQKQSTDILFPQQFE